MKTNTPSLGSLTLIAETGDALAANPQRAAAVAAAKGRVDLANPATIAEWGDDVQEGLARFNNAVVSRAKASHMGEPIAFLSEDHGGDSVYLAPTCARVRTWIAMPTAAST